MTPDRWRQIEQLFEGARARPVAERGAYLASACGVDTDLRGEVESLLTQADSRDSFLETPAADFAGPSNEPPHGALIGRRIGPYEVAGLIGVGGMGEVYRAKDRALGREVAIKVLPPAMTGDPARRARFEREARMLAAVTHPNIATIHGIETFDGHQALVMELVEGETLEARIARGPLKDVEVFGLALQIAQALDAAHEKGVIHRDLKPANVKVLSDGRVKLLDFGLAKAASGDESGRDLTMAADGTSSGLIVGTPRYMSPEQARGQAVDKRTDIWAFGCVLYEMLVGRPAVPGTTLADTIAAVVGSEPDWAALPANTPADIRKLLRRCFEKDPSRRQRDIGDVRVELETVLKSPAAAPPSSQGRVPSGRFMVAAIGLVGALGAFAMWPRSSAPPPSSSDLLDVAIAAPPGTGFHLISGVAMSPDGTSVAFVAGNRLWVRAFTEAEPRAVARVTNSAPLAPYWSPDGRRLAYGETGAIRAVNIDTGEVAQVAPVPSLGGTWVDGSTLLFGQSVGPIRRASPGAGLTDVTRLAEGETAHRWPFMLPDRDHFLYLAIRGEAADLRVGSLAASTTVSLGPSQSNATYAAGHLLYAQGGSLMAQPFDLATFERRGRPVRLAGSVFLSGQFGAFSSSENGRLVSMPNARPRTQLTSFTRSGAPTRFGLPGAFYNLALSADERYLAVSMDGGEPPNTDIYVLDLLRGDGARRLTTDPRGEFDPVWSPDGSTLVFNSNRSGQYRLMRRLASGDGDDEALFSSETDFTSFSSPTFSPDGRVLLFTAGRGSVTASGGLWFADLPVGDGGLKPFFASPASASGPVFSPDGRWVLYTSNTSGRSEIYLRRFPEATGLVQVSVDGGSAGRWRGDGREIYFLSPDRDLMAVDVAAKGRSMEPGVPRVLFRPGLSVSGGRPFVVTKDGQRFIMAVPEAAAPDPVISLLVNWPARLKQ